MNRLDLAIDFASNWEVRGGVWRYGIELARAMVATLGREHVILPVYDRLPEGRLIELVDTQADVQVSVPAIWFDRLDAMRARNGRFIPWKAILALAYRPGARARVFRSALGPANVYHAVMACRGRPRNGATVSTIHDLTPLHVVTDSSIPKDKLLGWIADHRRLADLVIVPSAAVRDDLVNQIGFPAAKLRVVHHGIDGIRFSPSKSPADAVLDRYGVRSGAYLLYVGALELHKNIDRMVAAYLAAIGERRDCPLLLAGAKSHESPALAAALADGTGRVRYVGYIPDDDLPDLYRHARALVHVAVAEGFGFTPLEAMSCGCPVVVSRHATTAEVVGENAILVDPLDVADIARGIREVLEDDARYTFLTARGPMHARQYSWGRCAERTLEVYQEAHSIWQGTT